MRYLVSDTEMKSLERHTINNIQIPSIVLMERAALAVRDRILSCIAPGDKVLVVCGIGNNGADGLAVARLLHGQGIFCAVSTVGSTDRATPEWKLQHTILNNLTGAGAVSVTKEAFGEYNIIVDAVFGIGLSRDIEGEYREVIEAVNKAGAMGRRIISVDIPSGINGDSGKPMGCAVHADTTVTFGFEKLGTRLFPGREYAGRVYVCDIGIPLPAAETVMPRFYTHTPDDYRLLPGRRAYSNKGTYGKLFIAAGSKNMSGAAVFNTLAAYRTGVGLVSVLTLDKDNRMLIQKRVPEAVMVSCDEDLDNELEKQVRKADAVICGSGLGMSEDAVRLVHELLKVHSKPVIFDADALNIIAANGWHERLSDNMVLTPHLGEMSRLTGKSIADIQSALIGTAEEYAAATEATVILKDAATVIADKDGAFYLNGSGNSGMATAGSGDVLCGVLGAMYAMYGAAALEDKDIYRRAASLSVYIHGLAGDIARKRYGERPMLARDICKALEKVMGEDEWTNLI